MRTETLCGRFPIKNLVPIYHYFLSMGGNVTKKFITMLNKNENMRV